jgi:hypothetical protein
VRICYATKSASDPDFALSVLAPLPHSKDPEGSVPYPGIPIGTGGPLPSAGAPLQEVAIRPYVISAKALADRGIVGTSGAAATAPCEKLLTPGFVPAGGFPDAGDAGALVENRDYWKLAPIPAGALRNDKTYVLAIIGCTSNMEALGVVGQCGYELANDSAQYYPNNTPGPGNLRASVFEIDSTATVASDEMGVQVVHVSAGFEWNRLVSAEFSVSPVFNAPYESWAKDASFNEGTAIRVLPNASATLPYLTVSPFVKLKGIVTTTGFVSARARDAGNGEESPLVPQPLNNPGHTPGTNPPVQELSEGRVAPSATPAYVNGKAYTFVLLGSAGSAVADQPLRRVHFVGFPNQFTPPSAN